MKKRVKISAVLLLVVSALFIAIPVMANTTVTGEVGSAYEIIAEDGTVYIISETEKGDELAAMVGEIVQVSGTVEEVEGQKTITVESFAVVNQ